MTEITDIEIKGTVLVVPPDIRSSHVSGAVSGRAYLAHINKAGDRWIDAIDQRDVEVWMTNSNPSNQTWRDANPGLFLRFGGEVKKPEPGIRIADRLTARDVGLRDPRDLGGISRDTMQIIRGRTR